MFTTIFIQPIYNVFVFILGLVPGGDVGLAIVILTLIVRVIFYPIFTSQIRTQMALQVVQPELDLIREKYKDKPQELVRRQGELFRKHHIRLSSMFGSLIVQLAIFLSLSSIFYRLKLPAIRTDLLYSFVHAPAAVSPSFFGLLDLSTAHHIVLAALVALSQYFVMRLTLRRTGPANTAKMTEAQLAAHKMQRQMMLYMFPVIMAIAAYFPAGAVGLYLLAMNLISLGQEWLIRRKPL